MDGRQAQVYWRGDRARGEDGVGEFEEGVAPGGQTFVERAAEGVESVGGIHNVLIMHSPIALRML
jgi:hypothetical protein